MLPPEVATNEKTFPARQFLYLLPALTCCLAVVPLNGVVDLTALAQSGCPQPDPERYPPHSKVYYDLGNITDPEQRRQIGEAIGSWNGGKTPQPPSDAPKGFRALAEFDKPENGGDGVISGADAVFYGLRLWKDDDQDGFSDEGELHTLPSLDVAVLHFDFKESKRTDAFGNQFRYRAKVDDAKGAKVGRWAWDVILVTSR